MIVLTTRPFSSSSVAETFPSGDLTVRVRVLASNVSLQALAFTLVIVINEVRLNGSPGTLNTAERDVLPDRESPEGVVRVHEGIGDETPKRGSDARETVVVLPSAACVVRYEAPYSAVTSCVPSG
jgi:hypothetical protein